MRARLFVSSVALALALAVSPGRALAGGDGPSARELVLGGSLMAIPTYFVGVTLHEGSHALVAHLAGATVTELKLWPAVDPVSGHFYFGLTRYRGRLTRGEKSAFLIAPKVTDLVALAGFAVLVELDGLPSNEWGQLALTVFATGSWVDFSNDMLSRNPGNDMVKLYDLRGHRGEWQRLPYRLLHLGLSAGAAYFIARSYVDLFGERDAVAAARIFPVWSMRF